MKTVVADKNNRKMQTLKETFLFNTSFCTKLFLILKLKINKYIKTEMR